MPNLLTELLSDLRTPAMLWQITVLVFCLALAWALSRKIELRVPKASGPWKYGVEGLNLVALPAAALLLVLLGRTVLARSYHGPLTLLNVAVPLLASLALIRIAAYVLHHVFPPSGWLKASERFIATAVWLGLALHLTGLLPEVTQALDELSFKVGTQKLSLLTLLSALVAVSATLLLALWLGRLLENRVMRAQDLDMSLRMAAVKFVRAALIVVGVMVALPIAGIDITVLSVFGGALGVGIGFGLQKIASNYAAGFIILLERSIRIGDTLTVENRLGDVVQLNTRYMVLKLPDGTEAIIPNETLITSTVLNHSYTDRLMRMALMVSVSYACDVETAMQTLIEIAQADARVLKEPRPGVALKHFGDNGIELELGLWFKDPEGGQLNLRSDLNLAILRAFRERGIEIPYPQREVRLIGPAAPAA